MPKTKTEKPISRAKKPIKSTKTKRKPLKKKVRKLTKKTKQYGKGSTKFFQFTGQDGKRYGLTFQQKEFVEFYLQFRGNGVDAIIEAGYDVWKKDKDGNRLYPNRKLAAVMSSENLIKPSIVAYKNTLLKDYGFNDEAVEEQHLFLLNQDADLKSKKGAIDMFYKLRGKYAPTQSTVTVKSKLNELTPEELQEIINTGQAPQGFKNE